jgi:hypothetical protein
VSRQQDQDEEDEQEGQHNDQHEEDAQGPKKTNLIIKPPQLKNRFQNAMSRSQGFTHDDSPLYMSGAFTQRVNTRHLIDDPIIVQDQNINLLTSNYSMSQVDDSFSIPNGITKPKLLEHIPCLFLPNEEGGNKLVLYFHGNAEDIGLAFDLLYLFGLKMGMHVLAIEYPGYGLYKTSKPNEQQIKEDAELIYDYLTTCVGIKEQDIILFGRSMGSGPTSYLSSIREPHCLLLMSPYTSIKEAARSLLGWASFLTFIVHEKFRNIDMIKKAMCPVFLLHGQLDTLIPHLHSEQLH